MVVKVKVKEDKKEKLRLARYILLLLTCLMILSRVYRQD